jgi:hypothetical protein
METGSREITVRGVRFWVGPEGREVSTRLQRAGAAPGPDDLVAEFGRIGRDGGPAPDRGSIRFDPVRRRAVVEFERRRETVDAPGAMEALERFLSSHLVPGKIILFP